MFKLELSVRESEIVGRQRSERIPPGTPAPEAVRAALDAAAALAFAEGIREAIARLGTVAREPRRLSTLPLQPEPRRGCRWR